MASSSSLPHFYSDLTTFSGDTSSQFHAPDVDFTLSSYLDDCFGSFNTFPNPESIFLPQVFGISDVSVPDYYQRMGVNNATRYFHGGNQDNYYGFAPEIKPLFHPSTGNNEGGIIQSETNTKVGRYSVEERKDRIMRYLKKKNQRNFNKTIKYVCRKTLADRRVRARGRFARNNDHTCEEQSPMSTSTKNIHNNHSEKDEDVFSGSDDYLIQMEHDDGWLHEAMSNLIPFPSEFDAPGDDHHSITWSF